MKNECNIIKDLLPLYNEKLISEDTKAFVDKHLADCEGCRRLQKSMEEPPELPGKSGIAPLQSLKNKLLKKKLAAIAFTTATVLAIVITGFAFLTSPQYLPYSEDILTFADAGNGIRVCSFSDEVTGYKVRSYLSDDGETVVYHISTWNTAWDMAFSKNSRQNAVLGPDSGNPIAIYYDLNSTAEDVLLYGAEPYSDYGVRSLPRLVLGYYLAMAVMAAVALAVLLSIFRKKPAIKLWIEKVFLFPISYVGGHLAIKGFSVATYSSQRDFLIILFVAILLYLACLLGIYLYRARKENQEGKTRDTDCDLR